MTFDFLKTLFPKSKVPDIIPFLDQAFAKFKISNPERAIMVLAHAAHECQGFTRFRENLNYSAQGLANTWPYRYATNPTAKVKQPNQTAITIEREPQDIANLTYAKRNGNGNVSSGDGWKFRGGGCGMTTGLANYKRVDTRLNMKGELLVDPSIIEEPYFAISSFLVFWEDNNLNIFADTKNIKQTRKIINGGLIGLEEVTSLYKKIEKHFYAENKLS